MDNNKKEFTQKASFLGKELLLAVTFLPTRKLNKFMLAKSSLNLVFKDPAPNKN